MQIFGSTPGSAAGTFEIQGLGSPSLITVDNLQLGGLIIITSVGFSQQANKQYMHALRNFVYVYSFGERMGSVEVRGLTFWQPCGGGSFVPGLSQLFRFYKQNSVSQTSTPITVTLGSERIRGFLDGVQSTFEDSQRGVSGFSLHISSLPELWK